MVGGRTGMTGNVKVERLESGDNHMVLNKWDEQEEKFIAWFIHGFTIHCDSIEELYLSIPSQLF
jgi:hypothetical protein